MSATPRLYKDLRKKLIGPIYIRDLAVRSPRIMAPNEPDPSLLIRVPIETNDPRLKKYSSKWGVYIGRTKYGNMLYYWDPEIMKNPIMAIVGIPGAGKSETIKTIILRFKRKEVGRKVPVIIVDPEGEYHVLVKQLGEGVVIRIGVKDYINLFDRPSCDYDYQLWVRQTVIPAIIKALKVSPQTAPLMIRILEDVIFRTYEYVKGFSPVDSSTWCEKEDPTLLDVVKVLEQDIKEMEQETKRPPRYRSAQLLLERLRRWVYGKGSDTFAHKSTVKLSELKDMPLVVFDIKQVPDDAKDVFTYYIFQYFYSLMKSLEHLAGYSFRLRYLLVFDEAWIILKRERGQEPELSKMARRVRKYGFGLIVATQRPEDIDADILTYAATVLVLQVRKGSTVKRLAESLNIPERLAKMIPVLGQGEVIVCPSWRNTKLQNANTPFIVKVDTAVRKMTPVVVYEPEIEEELKRIVVEREAGKIR